MKLQLVDQRDSGATDQRINGSMDQRIPTRKAKPSAFSNRSSPTPGELAY